MQLKSKTKKKHMTEKQIKHRTRLKGIQIMKSPGTDFQVIMLKSKTEDFDREPETKKRTKLLSRTKQ